MKCNHKFKIIEDTLAIENSFLFGKSYTQIYILQCQKCGDIKLKKHYMGNEAYQSKRIKIK